MKPNPCEDVINEKWRLHVQSVCIPGVLFSPPPNARVYSRLFRPLLNNYNFALKFSGAQDTVLILCAMYKSFLTDVTKSSLNMSMRIQFDDYVTVVNRWMRHAIHCSNSYSDCSTFYRIPKPSRLRSIRSLWAVQGWGIKGASDHMQQFNGSVQTILCSCILPWNVAILCLR